MDSEVYTYLGSPSYTASGGGVDQCPWGCGGGFYDGDAGFVMWTSLGEVWMIMILLPTDRYRCILVFHLPSFPGSLLLLFACMC